MNLSLHNISSKQFSGVFVGLVVFVGFLTLIQPQRLGFSDSVAENALGCQATVPFARVEETVEFLAYGGLSKNYAWSAADANPISIRFDTLVVNYKIPGQHVVYVSNAQDVASCGITIE